MTSNPRKYAEGTNVPIHKTMIETDKLLSNHGATRRGTGQSPEAIAFFFEHGGIQYRIRLPLPSADDPAIKYTKINQSRYEKERTPAQLKTYIEQETARRLRALYASIKARLIAIAEGIETTETAFHANIILANGQTMQEWAAPQVEAMYTTGHMPPLLPGIDGPPQLTQD